MRGRTKYDFCYKYIEDPEIETRLWRIAKDAIMQRNKNGRDLALDALCKSSYAYANKNKFLRSWERGLNLATVKEIKNLETETRLWHIAKRANMQRKRKKCYGEDFSSHALSHCPHVRNS